LRGGDGDAQLGSVICQVSGGDAQLGSVVCQVSGGNGGLWSVRMVSAGEGGVVMAALDNGAVGMPKCGVFVALDACGVLVVVAACGVLVAMVNDACGYGEFIDLARSVLMVNDALSLHQGTFQTHDGAIRHVLVIRIRMTSISLDCDE